MKWFYEAIEANFKSGSYSYIMQNGYSNQVTWLQVFLNIVIFDGIVTEDDCLL